MINGRIDKYQFANGKVTEYIYSADGTRLQTTHTTAVAGITVGPGLIRELTRQGILSTDTTYYMDNFIYDSSGVLQYHFADGYTDGTADSSHYYIRDHQGNNRVVAKGDGTIEQTNHYYPYGGILSQSTNQGFQKFKYNGKEYDNMHGLNMYDFGARQQVPAAVLFTSMDPLCEKYYNISPYVYCAGNPIRYVDPDGKKTVVFATKLPGDTSGSNFWLHTVAGSATHTFIAVFDNKTNALRGYFAFGPREGLISGPLEKMSLEAGHERYMQDLEIIHEYRTGTAGNDDRCKSAWSIETVDPHEQDKFDDKVITTGNSYEPISTTEYNIAPSESNGTVNCNKGSYNLLKQAGVNDELLKEIGERLPGKIWGWGQNMPWTQEEQYIDYSKRTWGK